jgi:hypothetical protein
LARAGSTAWIKSAAFGLDETNAVILIWIKLSHDFIVFYRCLRVGPSGEYVLQRIVLLATVSVAGKTIRDSNA